jgi:uncharacterized protein YqjF (DUF2071 family)
LNREEAEKAFGIIRRVIQNTREDLVAHNWGQIWLCHAFTNPAACLCGWYVESQQLPLFWYLVPLAVVGLVNLLIILALVKRDQGVRSYVEWQIHGIWLTFIVFTLAGALVLQMTGASPTLFGPLFALTSGFGFAMMGVVFSRQWPYAVMFLVITVAGPLVNRVALGAQWGLIALAWWAAMFLPGLSMYRENASEGNMKPPPNSSNSAPEPDEAGLAVLVACHHRGPLTVAELAQLLSPDTCSDPTMTILVERGLLEVYGDRHAVTQKGRDYLDRVLEGIESQLAPDDPAYVRRYRREEPTLPFDTNTTWAQAVAVNFRVEPAALRPLVPAVFELDLYQGHAFVSLTASRLKDFGVGWLPQALRMNFYQATYRAHVTHTDFRGRTMRGCYFLRSETNSRLMSLAANMLPEFRAHRCSTYPMFMGRHGDHLVFTVDSGDDPAGKVVLVLDTARPLTGMPASSVFPSISAAYQFLVDFYDAFAYDPDSGEVMILRIERGDWPIQVVEPVDHYFGFSANGPFPPGIATLDSVFYFTNVPYRWLPLLKERIKQR